jgi:hypothetical protein
MVYYVCIKVFHPTKERGDENGEEESQEKSQEKKEISAVLGVED